MMSKCKNKARLALSSLSAIPFAASFTLIAADCAQAEEPRYGGRPVYAEVQITPPQNPMRQGYPPQQAGPGPAGPHKPEGDWKFTVGAATIYKPAFIGSKDYQAVAFPDFKVEYKDRFFASLFEGVGYNVVNNDSWRAGPIMKFDFGRTEDDDNPFRIAGDKTKALKGLGDVDASVELGGFVEYSFGPFSTSLELRQGVGGHEGLIGETGLNYKGFADLLGKPVMYSFGPRATFADSNYNEAYFGINQSQSAKSGLAQYSAGSGLVSYGIGAFAMMPVSDAVSVGIFGGYDRLASEAADSPLIKERGDENQFMGGLRITYEFGL